MRTYKFKAWNGTKMLLSENAEFYLIPNNKVQVPSQTGHEFYDKDYPIMQFTGLLDKNGKEIYEGDIVRVDGCSSNGLRLEVLWDEDRCCFEIRGRYNISHYAIQLDCDCALDRNMEVIGNIHIHEK